MPVSFTAEELDGMAAHVERELMETGGVHRIYAVWGRKPMDAHI